MSRGAPTPRPKPIARPKGLSDATGRTPKDYAIEHAEYLAKNAEDLLETLNNCIGEETEFINNEDSELGEAIGSLRSGIYEFRKRAARSKTCDED